MDRKFRGDLFQCAGGFHHADGAGPHRPDSLERFFWNVGISPLAETVRAGTPPLLVAGGQRLDFLAAGRTDPGAVHRPSSVYSPEILDDPHHKLGRDHYS